MVIKTESCVFTENKIYPGHGTQFVRRDGRLVRFLDPKAASLYHQGRKAQRLTWTQAWRRMNKKVRIEAVQKRARKKRVKLAKAVGGLSVEELRRRRNQKPELRSAQREAALREIKERKKKEKEERKKTQSKQFAQSGPKMQFSKKGKR